MQGWHYGKGLIYYRPIINQCFAVVLALHSVLFYFTLKVTSGYSISLIRDPTRGTSQIYLHAAWTSTFKQCCLPSSTMPNSDMKQESSEAYLLKLEKNLSWGFEVIDIFCKNAVLNICR